MVRIGIVGVGFMGMIHFTAAKRVKGAKVVAIATRDAKKRGGDWTGVRGNFGPPGGKEDLAGVRCHAEYAELIANPDVDLVDICLPNDLHAQLAIAALQAGKHVLVEKPIALSLADADAMVAAARKSGKQLMVAHVLPFFADFKYAYEAVRSSRYGRLLAGHLRRHISPPDWSAAIADAARTGGPIVDLHIHDNHFVVLCGGMPEAVFSRGIDRDGSIEFVATQYLYPSGGTIVTATSGAISQKSRPFTHGYELYFEKATLFYEAGQPLQFFGPDNAEQPKLGGGDDVDSFAAELTEAVAAVANGTPSAMLDGKLARDALALCLAESESVRTGKIVPV